MRVEQEWARGLPLQDPLLPGAVLDVWRAAMAAAGVGEREPGAPRDIEAARALLDRAAEALIAMVERGERRNARLLTDVRRCAEEVAEASVAYRLRVTASVYAALARLRAAPTEAELLEHAVRELTRCGFDRVILTRIEGATGYIAAAHDAREPQMGRAVRRFARERSLQIEKLKLEAEMLRRRKPLIVAEIDLDDPGVHPLLTLTGCRCYVAAPIVPQGKVIGFLHADCHHQRRLVNEFDRDRLWMFAEGFGYVFERRVLLDRIRALRQEVRRNNTSIAAVMHEYGEAPIELSSTSGADLPMARSAAAMFVSSDADPRRLLTKREREVMAHVAVGLTNARIADELFLSEQTVRSHVKRILRKLRAANRAEAVARWTSLGG